MGPATVEDKMFVAGQTWVGSQVKISNQAACSQFVDWKALSLQVIEHDISGILKFIGSAHHGDHSYACVSQTGFNATYTEDKNIHIYPDDAYYHPYNKCFKHRFDPPFRNWIGSISEDNTTITSYDPSNCTRITLTKVMADL